MKNHYPVWGKALLLLALLVAARFTARPGARPVPAKPTAGLLMPKAEYSGKPGK